MDVLSRIKELQTTQGISTYELAKKSGIAVNTIYNWYRLNYSPTLDTLQILCEKGFGITMAQFFAMNDEIVVATPEMMEMFHNWTMLNDEQKEAVKIMIASYKKNK